MLDPESLGIIDEEYGFAGPSSSHHVRRRGPRPNTSSSSSNIPVTHSNEVRRRQTGGGGTREREKTKVKKDKRFLREVQDELEEQRAEWKDEVDRLMTVSNPEIFLYNLSSLKSP